MAKHPHLHIEVEFNDKKIDLLSEGYDLALRIGYMEDSSLVSRKIGTTTVHFAASPNYLETNGIPQTPDDLEHHNGLLYKKCNESGKLGWFTYKSNPTFQNPIQSSK